MTAGKRAFDIGLAILLLPVLLLPGLLVGFLVLILDGRPALYASPRVKQPGRVFSLWKFRTMAPDVSGPERGVTGGDKQHRITTIGGRLRRTRLDELPQLWNVLRGDISFVGPRPPAPLYVNRFPKIYRAVLRSRPGITGLASVIFHAHEEWLLRKTKSPEETSAVYERRCIPRKAHLDLIYQRNQTLGLDLYILYLTAGRFLPLPGRRLNRLKRRANRT